MTSVVVDTPVLRKSRGAFFTPPRIADYLATWAISGPCDRVLEPSCGEAVFLLAAGRRVRELGGDPGSARLVGVEMHGTSASRARAMLADCDVSAEIRVSDFFDVAPTGDFAAVIGNPPYVRYQEHAGAHRVKSRAAALRAGVALTGLASSWAAFTVHAAQFLRPGGRLGLVLPAELLSVNYAADVRRFLMQTFAQVNLVLFTERVFAEVQEEVVLLLASGYQRGSTDHTNNYQARNADDLDQILASTKWRPGEPSDKWTPLLLSARALPMYSGLLASDAFTTLHSWGETTLGMVTGNNRYFALSPARVAELGLRRSDLIKLSPPGSRHLRGLELSQRSLRELGAAGGATSLFRPAGGPSPAAQAYIQAGEVAGVDTAYKCTVRTPWWRVPLVRPADLLLTYMNADTPRITTNKAGAHHLNSVHGVYLHASHRDLGLALLPVASLNSMTMLGAEVVGRAYGGGMLKLEPKEADRLPVPSLTVVHEHAEALTAVRPKVARLLRQGQLAEAAAVVDEILLAGGLNMCDTEVRDLREEVARLSQRRASRA